jgi:predicted ester cyclase
MSITIALGKFAALAVAGSVPTTSGSAPGTPEEVIRGFCRGPLRSRPERAAEFLAAHVAAHQMNAEDERVVTRSPAEYVTHVREMQAAYGPFALEITELLTQGDRVYVRWRQRGTHVGEIEGYRATGKPLVEIGSAVYRVAAGRIVEYWIQLDRQGLHEQLEQNLKAQ